MFRFHHNQLQLKEMLGKGRFGAVFPYQKEPQDLKWVVKRIQAENSDILVASLPEVVLGFSCDHPRVVPVKGYFIEKDSDGVSYNIYMKLPRMKETLGDNFKERKRKNNPYKEQDIIRHFHSLACGLEYLQSKKIYHGDIKPDNLLLDENGVLKIADVGIAKHVEDEDSYQTLTGQVGTYLYSAPEVLGEKPTKGALPKADVWSMGVVILELCLFDFRLLNSSLPQEKLQNRLDELFKSLQGKYHDSLVGLVQRVLSLDPKKRPEIGEVRTELEKNFAERLDQNLLQLGKSALIQKESQVDIRMSNQHVKEILEKYEAETNQLKEKISQLELQLDQQKRQYEARIEDLMHQNSSNHLVAREQEPDELEAERKAMSEKLANINEKLRMSEEQRASYEQKSKDLEKYIETTVKDQMKAYEDQIKTLQESQRQERVQFSPENKLLEDLNSLQPRVKELESFKIQPKREFGKSYEKKLQKVVLQLEKEFNQSCKFQVDNHKLVVLPKSSKAFGKLWFTDEVMKKLSQGLIRTLCENDMLNLFGLEFDFYECLSLTDQGVADAAKMISNQSLHLQCLSLNFSRCDKLTDESAASIATAISNQSLHLRQLTLQFRNIANLSDKGLECIAIAVEKFGRNLEELQLDFSGPSYYRVRITDKKKEELRERFAHIPKLQIK